MELSLLHDISTWAPAAVATPSVILGALGARAFAIWLNHSRLKPAEMEETRRGMYEIKLRPPFPVFLLGFGTFSLFGSITVLSAVFPNGTATAWTTLLFLTGTLLGFLFLLEFIRARHTIYSGPLHSSGIEYGRMFGGRKRMSWLSVRKVRYRRFLRWFTLESATGDIARISVSAVGIVEFADEILECIEPHKIDERTRRLLVETASDNPPAFAD